MNNNDIRNLTLVLNDWRPDEILDLLRFCPRTGLGWFHHPKVSGDLSLSYLDYDKEISSSSDWSARPPACPLIGRVLTDDGGSSRDQGL